MDEQKLKDKITELESDLALYKNEVARANAQLEQILEKLQVQLQSAHAIHELLVPKEIPQISGFEFSSKYIASAISGGDYFDIFHIEDKFRFGVLLTSSSGFGISALFLSVLLRLTNKLETKKGMSPQDFLKDLHTQLQPHFAADDSSKVFYALIDRRNFEMQFATAGKLNCWHYQASNQKLLELDCQQDEIKRASSAHFVQKAVSLNPNDKLILCSQGISDIQNAKKEKFGADRLTQILLQKNNLSVHELRNEILFQVQAFQRGQENNRDMTVLVIEIKNRLIKLAQ